ncbi:hypothetical protein [Planktomarina sp.]|uniref:hypothetical protein n=1 Tax=Planktomarina sp. TaxID=2024851 RepID=UPI00325FF59E
MTSHSGRFPFFGSHFLRAPIGLAMIGVGVAGTYMVIGSTAMTLNQLKTLTYGTFSNYSFSIIPLFLLMGQFVTLSGMFALCSRPLRAFWPSQGRCGDVSGRGLCWVWRDLAPPRDSRNNGPGGLA